MLIVEQALPLTDVVVVVDPCSLDINLVATPGETGVVAADDSFAHIVEPKIEFVQSVFSDSALGDDTST